jgi:hypothetical protein
MSIGEMDTSKLQITYEIVNNAGSPTLLDICFRLQSRSRYHTLQSD